MKKKYLRDQCYKLYGKGYVIVGILVALSVLFVPDKTVRDFLLIADILYVVLANIYAANHIKKREMALKVGERCAMSDIKVNGLHAPGHPRWSMGYDIVGRVNGKKVRLGTYSDDPTSFLGSKTTAYVYYYKGKYYLEEMFVYDRGTMTSEQILQEYSAEYMALYDDKEAYEMRRGAMQGNGKKAFCLWEKQVHINEGHFKLFIDIYLLSDLSITYNDKKCLEKMVSDYIKGINYDKYDTKLFEVEEFLKKNIPEWLECINNELRVKDVIIASKQFEVVQYQDLHMDED